MKFEPESFVNGAELLTSEIDMMEAMLVAMFEELNRSLCDC